ncbi:MAG: DUF1028 domain-containing protein [Bacteroidales bacterium]|nr:DUF1028 domain-containing protein [Bacteroidales bacterium]
MKNLLLLLIVNLFIYSVHSQDTFSICAIDTVTGEVGSAGASCIGAPQIPQGCSILSDVLPGIGVIHTQAYYLAGNQNYARQLMEMGLPPQQIVDSLVANDVQNNPTIRQYGVVDLYEGSARCAAFTGINCDDYKNHITGPNYTIQGNILLGQQILDSMETRFLNSEGELACRLMAALQGAKVIGADTRCMDDGVSSLSAFLRVAQPNDPVNDLYLDLNVPSTPDGVDPIDSLQVLVDEWMGCFYTGVQSNTNPTSVVVFPNPSNGKIIFELHEKSIKGKILLNIFNPGGQVVYQSSEVKANKMFVNEKFRPGIYYYKITEENQIITFGKLIIR